jgi:hypothetical protein
MSAGENLSAMIDDRAGPVRDRLCMRDDCLVVESMKGYAGSKKPHPGDRARMLKRAMPHAPRLAKESS